MALRRGHPGDGHRRLGGDRPLQLQARDALERHEPGIFWEAHQANLAYSQIERLVNLGQLPPDGFTVSCLPLPIAGASAAPARVVAILDRRDRSAGQYRRSEAILAPSTSA